MHRQILSKLIESASVKANNDTGRGASQASLRLDGMVLPIAPLKGAPEALFPQQRVRDVAALLTMPRAPTADHEYGPLWVRHVDGTLCWRDSGVGRSDSLGVVSVVPAGKKGFVVVRSKPALSVLGDAANSMVVFAGEGDAVAALLEQPAADKSWVAPQQPLAREHARRAVTYSVRQQLVDVLATFAEPDDWREVFNGRPSRAGHLTAESVTGFDVGLLDGIRALAAATGGVRQSVIDGVMLAWTDATLTGAIASLSTYNRFTSPPDACPWIAMLFELANLQSQASARAA